MPEYAVTVQEKNAGTYGLQFLKMGTEQYVSLDVRREFVGELSPFALDHVGQIVKNTFLKFESQKTNP